ncbi:MAG TPA: hypothetical protein PLQ24_04480, partial [Methanothrix sp.]|nr:hypothetical protein [Methanothrix sp.]
VLNSKIVPYRIYDGIMVFNLFLMLAVLALLGFFMERNLQKGVEAHESASGRGAGNGASVSRISEINSAKSVIKMLRRK